MNKTVLVVGLGNMGSALARTLLEAGYETWVWNRTKEKADPLLQKGAQWSENIWTGLSAVDYIVVCVSNYTNSLELLSSCPDLGEKVLIQLTTGTASDAVSFQHQVVEKRGRYMDGAIMAYPAAIGHQDCLLLVAGNLQAWGESEALILTLGGQSQYLGEDVGVPAHLDHALIAPSLIMQMAIIQGMHMAQKAGVDLDFYSRMMGSGLSVSLKSDLERHTRAIIDDDFSEVQASIRTWKEALERILEESEGSKVNVDLLTSISQMLAHGVDQGVGEEDIASLTKVMS